MAYQVNCRDGVNEPDQPVHPLVTEAVLHPQSGTSFRLDLGCIIAGTSPDAVDLCLLK